MKVEIKIDPDCERPRVVVITDRVTDEVNEMISRLNDEPPRLITGVRDGEISIIEREDIFRIYAASGKVFAVTQMGEYVLKLRLYELEQRLDKKSFVRISNSEIINLKKVKGFDLSLSGTIRVTLCDGTSTYASRRYVARIKQLLGL
mgnify:CR=1 FL=1